MPTPGAHPIDELIVPGMLAFSRGRGYEGVMDDGVTQIDPKGGVVLDVWQAPNDDGEIETCYRVLDPWHMPVDRPGRFAYDTIRESELDRDRLAPAQTSTLWNLYYRLAEHIGCVKAGKRRRGMGGPELFQYHADMDAIRRVLVP